MVSRLISSDGIKLEDDVPMVSGLSVNPYVIGVVVEVSMNFGLGVKFLWCWGEGKVPMVSVFV